MRISAPIDELHPKDDEKLLRDTLPRVDEMGFKRYPGKTLTVIGEVATQFLLSIEILIK